MILDKIVDEEIRNAINDYKRITKDPANLTLVNPKILDEMRRLEFQSEFIGLARIENREKRVREELKLYVIIKDNFAHYIGLKLVGKFNFSFKVSREAYISLGRLILDNSD